MGPEIVGIGRQQLRPVFLKCLAVDRLGHGVRTQLRGDQTLHVRAADAVENVLHGQVQSLVAKIGRKVLHEFVEHHREAHRRVERADIGNIRLDQHDAGLAQRVERGFSVGSDGRIQRLVEIGPRHAEPQSRKRRWSCRGHTARHHPVEQLRVRD